MWLMLQQEQADDYVVATGQTHSVREFLDLAFKRVGLDWNKYVQSDQRYFRPADVDMLQGDASKARNVLNWKSKVDFEELVAIMIDADWELAKQEKFLVNNRIKSNTNEGI